MKKMSKNLIAIFISLFLIILSFFVFSTERCSPRDSEGRMPPGSGCHHSYGFPLSFIFSGYNDLGPHNLKLEIVGGSLLILTITPGTEYYSIVITNFIINFIIYYLIIKFLLSLFYKIKSPPTIH